MRKNMGGSTDRPSNLDTALQLPSTSIQTTLQPIAPELTLDQRRKRIGDLVAQEQLDDPDDPLRVTRATNSRNNELLARAVDDINSGRRRFLGLTEEVEAREEALREHGIIQ